MGDIYERAKTYSIASLVLGIIALILSLSGALGFIGFICAIIGIILGSKARKVLPYNQRGMATAGWVCSIIALCLAFFGIIVIGGLLGLIGLGAIFS